MPDWNWHKTKQKLSTILRLNIRYLKIIHIIHPRYHPQDNRRYSKKCAKKQVRLFKWVYMMNDNENKTRPRHGHKYPKNKMCLSMIMLVCIKQHLSNIWSSIHEKVKQHWGWIKKKCVAYQKNLVVVHFLPNWIVIMIQEAPQSHLRSRSHYQTLSLFTLSIHKFGTITPRNLDFPRDFYGGACRKYFESTFSSSVQQLMLVQLNHS